MIVLHQLIKMNTNFSSIFVEISYSAAVSTWSDVVDVVREEQGDIL